MEATWLRPLLVSSGSHAATPHPRGRKEKRKRRPRTPKSYPSVKSGQLQGDGILEDAVLGVGDLALERGGWWAVVFEGVGGGLPSAQEEGAHPLCPLFPVESCEGVEFAK